EFKNEIILISKLQHTYLVKLIGRCVKQEEKILDPIKKNTFDRGIRFNIIEGIARGLLYLHKYSRLRIITETSKQVTFVDGGMNPKISDYDMAKIFGSNESDAKTKRVVGTHGYMLPEYALKGTVSTKVDVFSFGVLLLIVSGKNDNLIGYAWKLWNEGNGLELIDSTLDESYPGNDVVNCIHIGLLCVQDQATDRPSMSDIVSMLTNETMLLPAPRQPVCF
ncbi:LOW QUALITY PROTEIN: Pkinase domain-containing protein, partial [Cephalotus follicularis]